MHVHREYDFTGDCKPKSLTLTESLLVQILLQVIASGTSSGYVKRVLSAAGLTKGEIETITTTP